MTDSPLPKRYVDIELIGEGGFGRVYRAHDTNLNRLVAAKVAKERRDESQDLDAFVTEARRSAGLQHRNIVAVYDLDFHEDHLFLTMEYAPNGTLEDLLASGTPDAALAIRFIQQAAAGLHFLHSCSIVHRDVKPSNLLLDRHDTVKVGDFGFAREFDRTTTHLGGTPGYAAPEQFNEGKNLNAATDVFGLAVTAYEILTGQRHGGFSTLASGDAPPPPSELVRDLSPAVDQALDRAMQLNRHDRTPSVMDFANELGAGFDHHPPRTAPAGATQPAAGSTLAAIDLAKLVAAIEDQIEAVPFVEPPAEPAEWTVIGVKWSGAAKSRDAARAIKIAVIVDDVARIEEGHDREAATAFIDALGDNSERALVGMDFGFGLPQWYMESEGYESALDVWAELAGMETFYGRDTQWPRAFLGYPYWGPQIRRKPAIPHARGWYRGTERTVRETTGVLGYSVFQLSGAGSVGSQSVRGVGRLLELRELGWAVWPFDPPDAHTIVEVFPKAYRSLVTGQELRSDPTAQRDALISAMDRDLHMEPDLLRVLEEDYAATDAMLAAWLLWRNDPDLPDLTDDPVAMVEGQIWLPE